MRSIKTLYRLHEMSGSGGFGAHGPVPGSGDPGAAMDAIGELQDIVEDVVTGRLHGGQLGSKLERWFTQNLPTIQQALGTDEDDDTGPTGAVEEGGPGSGPKPGQKKAKKDDAPSDSAPTPPKSEPAPSSGLPSEVERAIRDAIESLESIVPDEDPEGDLPPPDDMPVPGGDMGPMGEALMRWVGKRPRR